MGIYERIEEKRRRGGRLFALLLDPENHTPESVRALFGAVGERPVDLVLVGGSLVSRPVEPVLRAVREAVTLPVVLFPGSLLQLSGEADALLMLNLISGRYPEYLAGNQVTAALMIRTLGLEVIPTGYILMGGGAGTAVEVISNTHPLPERKKEIILATALAGEYMGSRLIYLEKGSGADSPPDADLIRAVRELLTVPLITGGGITDAATADKLFRAGADMVVVGNAIEENISLVKEMKRVAESFQP
jgi:putative glycerol-1-phosphate prenyltransferase